MTTSQMNLNLAGCPTAREILDRIRKESRDESEKGRWFEQLFTRVALQDPAFEIDGIWRWSEWPEREELTSLDGRDIGIDLVARRTDGTWVAIQCKCYDERHTLPKGEIDKFLGGSQHEIFSLRWIVAACRWGPSAESAIEGANPQIGRIGFREYLDVQVEEEHARRPIQEPWPLQAEAIENAVTISAEHGDGIAGLPLLRFIPACVGNVTTPNQCSGSSPCMRGTLSREVFVFEWSFTMPNSAPASNPVSEGISHTSTAEVPVHRQLAILTTPGEYLVRVHVIPARHNRHRSPRRAALRNDPALQSVAPTTMPDANSARLPAFFRHPCLCPLHGHKNRAHSRAPTLTERRLIPQAACAGCVPNSSQCRHPPPSRRTGSKHEPQSVWASEVRSPDIGRRGFHGG